MLCGELDKLYWFGAGGVGVLVAYVFVVDMQDMFIPMDGKSSKRLLRTTLKHKFRT